MKVLADESVFAPMIDALRREGHSVTTARQAGLLGADDERVYRAARVRRYVLLTLDKDFTRSRRFNPKPLQGIVVVKLFEMSVDEAARLLASAVRGLTEDVVRGKLVIVTRAGSRIRAHRAEGS